MPADLKAKAMGLHSEGVVSGTTPTHEGNRRFPCPTGSRARGCRDQTSGSRQSCRRR